MAFAPLITRLYNPEAFGLLGTFMSILAIAAPLATLSYHIAIVLPKSDVDAINLAKLSAGLSFFMAVVVTVILLLTKEWIITLFNLQSIADFLLLIPLAMLFSASHQILQQWFIRKKQFKITARAMVIQSLITNFAKAVIGWFYPIASALIILFTIDKALHATLLYLNINQSVPHTASQKLANSNSDGEIKRQISSIKALAKQHKDFPLYRTPQIVINALSQSLPVLILANFFGSASAGFYALGKVVMGMPITLLSQSVGDVFYPRITEAAHNQEDLFRLILKATLLLTAIGFIPFASVVIFGPWLFSFIFGSEWVTAGEYAQWLALWLFFMFINRPSVVALPVISEQAWLFYYELFSTGTKVIALGVGSYYFKDDLIAVALFCIVGIIAYLYLILRTISKAKRYTNAKTS